MKDRLREIRSHVDAALTALPTDDDMERLVNPRHTDHDRHVYLPTKVAQGLAAARAELEAAVRELSGSSSRPPED